MKTRKLNASIITALVMGVLMVMGITAGATLAWFASRDAAQADFTLGQAVTLFVSDSNGIDSSGQLQISTPNGMVLLPGMVMRPSIAATFIPSTTPSLLRARFVVEASGVGQGLVDALVTELNNMLEGGPKSRLLRDDSGNIVYDVDGITPLYDPSYSPVPANYTRKISDGWWQNNSLTVTIGPDTFGTGWWYFLGNGDTYSQVATVNPDGSATYAAASYTVGDPVDLNTSMASVILDAGPTVPFLVNDFMLPSFITNEFASAGLTFRLEFQAVQDYLIDPASDTGERVATSIGNAIVIYEDALTASF